MHKVRTVARNQVAIIPTFILRDDGLSIHAKVLYGLLLYYREFHDGVIPTYRNIGVDLGTPKSTVVRKMKELEHKGFVTRSHPGRCRRVTYRLKHGT